MNYGFGPINSQTAFLSNDFTLPDDFSAAIELINKREFHTAACVNLKEIGQYETTELLTGQTWFRTRFEPNQYGQSQLTRYGYRRVFDLVALTGGPIPTGNTTIRINPPIQAIVIPTKGYGAATIAGPQYFFFPSVDITFYFDNSDPTMQSITIDNTLTVPLEQCYVTIEYLKQS